MAQAFLERCMQDPAHWSEFDNLPEKVKAIILDRFLDKYNMNLDAFKRCAHSLLNLGDCCCLYDRR